MYVLYSNIAAPLSPVSQRQAIGCEKFQTNYIIAANFRFSAQNFRNWRKVFPKYLGEAIAPPLATASTAVVVICFFCKTSNGVPRILVMF